MKISLYYYYIICYAIRSFSKYNLTTHTTRVDIQRKWMKSLLYQYLNSRNLIFGVWVQYVIIIIVAHQQKSCVEMHICASSVAYVWTYNNNNNHSFNNDDDNGVVGRFLVVFAYEHPGILHLLFRGNSFQWKLSISIVRFWHTRVC